jgi:His/Glu/Gln/Arg/opine family amino acid ABC transporter permease subunit
VTLTVVSFLLGGAKTTIIVTSGAWLVSALVGLVLAMVQGVPNILVRAAADLLVMVLRAVPQLLVLFILYFGLATYGINFGSLAAAILGLGLTEAGNTAEYYRAGFFTVTEEQREAGYSIGLSRLGVTRYVVMPQVAPFLVPPLLNTYVGLLKLSTLAAAVNAPEIIFRAQLYMSNHGDFFWLPLTVIALYLIVTLPLLRGIAVLENRLRRRAGSSLGSDGGG